MVQSQIKSLRKEELKPPRALWSTPKVLRASLPWLLGGRPAKKRKKCCFFLFERHILVSCHLFGAKQIQKSPMFRYKEPILRKYCFSKPAPDTTSSFNESWQFPNKNTFNSPGVFQGVRLSRKFPDGSVLQPEVVDEVIKIIAHSHLSSTTSHDTMLIVDALCYKTLVTLYGVGFRERLWSCLRVLSDLWTCCLISVMVGRGSGILPLSHTLLYIDSTLCGIT